MRQPLHKTAKLPQQLLDELGLGGNISAGPTSKHTRPGIRKERRKAARAQKRVGHTHPTSRTHNRVHDQAPRREIHKDSSENVKITQGRHSGARAEAPKSILKSSNYQPVISVARSGRSVLSPSPPPRLSQGVKDRLEADNAEIKALEKALGIQGKKKLPKSFEDDGLDTLLDGLDELNSEDGLQSGKRKRSDEKEWLEKKRRKANGEDKIDLETAVSGQQLLDDFSSTDADQEADDVDDDSDVYQSTSTANESVHESFQGFDGEPSTPDPPQRRVRENPYIAPTSNASTRAKYIPPSLRVSNPSEQEELQRLRRQIQGLLNRLSEANLISILGDVEKLYRDNPRQHVSTTLLELLMGLLCDPTTLQDTFIILHAGFIAAVYKVIGTDFGAQAVQRIVEEFDRIYIVDHNRDSDGKKLNNLISLVAELYNFQVVGSGLVYDFVRIFLGDLSETTTELLLKVVRISGPQLRQDDPTSLKDIVLLLQPAITRIVDGNLSVRTKFMVETINNLKNNRMKTGVAASTVTSEHTIRMKKTLGSLNTRNIKASEPLRIGLRDIRDTEKRGKWWLVGASYRDEGRGSVVNPAPVKSSGSFPDDEEDAMLDDGPTDLAQLAREQRMNTDIRRSIFISIMSATDYRDAHLRLLKLRLKKSQELEIPKVLIHCAGAENVYNPFYTLISKRLCSDRKLKMAFQFSLWDLFKRMGESDESGEDADDERDDVLGMRNIVNLAKMFGVLVAEGGLGLGILKNLNLAYLQPKTRTFVELFFITLFVHSQQGCEARRNEKPLIDIFLKVKDVADLARGVHYFLKKIVSKTDVAGSKQDDATVKWGCKVAGDALVVIASSNVADK